jgi:hypothetical protein
VNRLTVVYDAVFLAPDISFRFGCSQLCHGLLECDSVLEGLIDRHHAVADGFQLVRLPRVGKEQVLAMPIAGWGRDVKPGPTPEIRDRPAAPAAPLT